MSTTVSVLGGVGLFLLGMSVMTAGLKGLAGSGLRTILSKAAATPLSGAFWGAIVTLIVQSSSATTMTTIGLVSAGVLTFPQGLALVFGANVGTTGTGWLVALIGVRVSLTAAALPMIFVGALIKLLGRGRVSAGGAALAGFALVLFGLTTLQQGMGGLAERLHPEDLPAVLGTSWWSGLYGVLALVVAGLVMTAVMQSSTAAIAVTLSAHYAGAVGLDQACALIIGQNIGTATSSALAAIGASSTAKRLALAYILFKLIAAVIALVLFPVTMPLLIRASHTIDGVTLLAGYHTAYNVVGVLVLLPVIDRFTRLVAYSARTRLAAYAVPRPSGAHDTDRDRGSGEADGGAGAWNDVRFTRDRPGGGESGRVRASREQCRVGDGGRRCPAPSPGIPVGGKRSPRNGGRAKTAHQHTACARPRVPPGRNNKRGREIRDCGRRLRGYACRGDMRGGHARCGLARR